MSSIRSKGQFKGQVIFTNKTARNMCNRPTSFFVHVFAILSTLGNYSFEKNNRLSPSLAPFCYIYNVFSMFLIDVFPLSSNTMSASLKKIGIFLNWRSKVNFKVKYDFSTNEARSKCDTSMLCDFDSVIHFLNYFNYSRPSSRLKGQFQGQIKVNIIFTKEN